jgi:uncharacterized protein
MIWAGFLMGLLGSLHCIGMCGPIALALPMPVTTLFARIVGAIIYNCGRVLTYSFFGLLIGFVGSVIDLSGIQQVLSIVSGVLLLLFILIPWILKQTKQSLTFFELPFIYSLKIKISKQLRSHTYLSLFGIGLLNGLLPCGLVSFALVASLAAGSVFNSLLFMALFGLGTLPIMITLIVSKNYMPVSLKNVFQRAIPVFICSLGLLLILRGMSLCIPYVSPSAEKSCCTTEQTCH